ncbi:hypothetical protein K469DRAFT_724916 [Zopfia rhizophila CBS 207.26]|uniref:ER-bound oxygenase mpaB/mpaB'/Rubber oxygenase catalytic domain-containing protein n=1 Tax=Zopfia rhizophila CBS 207.26 TaxID=1314779 RepID=A0A6A6D9I6_9PEZI|nr:hypothetical protein K469DRAFT_724916 [Zopfia rhizophila CBS 207.26]
MTTKEAYNIMTLLQELEFPSAFNKARTIGLLKAGGIPTMSKLFAVTGQNNRKNAGKRAVDTEILLREVQSKDRESIRYMEAVARMNYLHARYRKAGKILNEDLLHTLGDGIVESFRIVDSDEWRKLSDMEKCAIGIFHKNLGEDMGISFTPLPSSGVGWEDGLHFLRDWTAEYEAAVARPVATNDQYVRVYVDSVTSAMPNAITILLRKIIGSELDDTMRVSLCIEAPGPTLKFLLAISKSFRKFSLRHICLPRPSFLAVKAVDDDPNPVSGLYNFNHVGFQPWYIEPTFGQPLGGRAPGTRGDKYHPQGYNLQTIGPKPQEGKGIDEMMATVEYLKKRGSSQCPFSYGRKS